MSDLLRLERKLGAALGLRPRRGSEANLRRELRTVERELGLGIEDIIARLDADPDLVGRLAGAITVEETFFLRHPRHFDRLVDHVRALLDTRRGGTAVLWSAGCASGEEPYSMAIALHRALGPERLRRVRIVANDIDGSSLRKAKRAVYGSWSFRGTDPLLRERYFEPVGDDAFRLVPAIRHAVVFEHRSLERELACHSPHSVDAIFFRNVAIYLTEVALARIYAGFSRVLTKGGLLVLAPSDPAPPRDLLSEDVLRRSLFPAPPAAAPPPAPTSAWRPYAGSPPDSRVLPKLLPATAGGASLKPLAPRPPSNAATTLASSGGASGSAVASTARELAHRGRLAEAIATLDHALSGNGRDPTLLGLRGCIHLAAADTLRGVEDLRAALFLDPADHWLRFQYAVGLHALHRHRTARAHLSDLLRSLEGEGEERVLTDGETTVGTLRRAASELLGRIA